MNNLKEQRFAVKFCVKLGKSTTETFAMLNMAYGDVAVKRATCFRWHKRFKNDRLSVEDDECSGRPSTSTDDPHIDEINTGASKSTSDCKRACWRMWDLGRLLSPNFDGRIKDASRCCKICGTSDDKWSTSSPCSSLSGFAWSLRKW